MSEFAKTEVEAAFEKYWALGAVDEKWDDWSSLFTEDVLYREHVYGEMRGRAAVQTWISRVMAQSPDIHAVLDWYVIQGSRVVVRMQNRYYNPDPAGAPFDFAGVTILEYGGGGLFRYEEDYWVERDAKRTYLAFQAAVKERGGRGLEGGRFEALEAERRAATRAIFARGG